LAQTAPEAAPIVLEVNLHCAACVRSTTKTLAELGLADAVVSLDDKTVTLPAAAAAKRDALIEALKKKGYEVSVRK